jgi:hypothetical protein
MALNDFVSGTVAAGQRITVVYQINGFKDVGCNVACANPKNPGGSLKFIDSGKEQRTGGQFVYWITFINQGVATNYTISAGGVV